MIARPLSWLLSGILTVVLITVSMVAFLLGTENGNRWLIDKASPFLPGELSIEQWHGHLFGALDIEGLRYQQDDLDVQLDHFQWQLNGSALVRGWVHLDLLNIGNLSIQLPDSDEAEDTEEAAPFSGLDLPEQLTLPIGIRIDQLQLQRLTLNGNVLVEDLSGDELAVGRRYSLPRLQATIAGAQLALSAQGELRHPYDIDGELRWQLPLEIDDQPDLKQASGILGVGGSLHQLTLQHQLQHPMSLHSRGTVDLRSGVAFDLAHRWAEQPLPMSLPHPMSLLAGTLVTSGNLSRVDVQGELAALVDEDRADLKLVAQYQDDSIELNTFNLDYRDQRLGASGHLTLSPMTWQLQLNGDIDTQLLHPELPGTLALVGATRGSMDDSGWTLQRSSLNIAGQLRDQPFSLAASAEGNARQLYLDSHLDWAGNRIQTGGTITDQLDLTVQLHLAQPSQLLPALDGDVRGQVAIHGPTEAPQLSGQIRGQQLRYGDILVESLDIDADKLGMDSTNMTSSIVMTQIMQGTAPLLDSVRVDLDGNINRHVLTLQVRHERAQFGTRLRGGLDDDMVWQGVLADTLLSEQALGQWQQVADSAVTLSADQQQLGEFCLRQQDSQLCLQGRHDDAGVHAAAVALQDFPLALVNLFTEPAMTLGGVVSLNAQLDGALDNLKGHLDVHTRDATMTVNDEETPLHMPIDQLSLQAQLDAQQFDGEFILRSALANVSSEFNGGLAENAPLSGFLRFDLPSIEMLSLLSVDVREITGHIVGDLALSGTLSDPIVTGNTQLREGGLTVPALGIAVTALHVDIAANPDGKFVIDGNAMMGQGQLRISGEMQPLVDPLGIQLNIDGERLLVANRPDARAWLTPNIEIQGRDGTLFVRGNLHIPEARLQPTEIPEGAVSVSEDQVMREDLDREADGLPIDIRVGLTLGDEVTFTGFGLTATLGGNLVATQQPERPLQLSGEFLIPQGRYRAYGQNLAIENGRLIFQGAPDNPGLDIRAIRRIPSENLVVGVQISGTLLEPRATIISDPQLEESQAMAYLITGRSLDSGSDSDNAQIAQALILYGLEQGSGVTSRIGDTLGLDSVTIGSDWETDDAALMLGKQISNRLFLTYAVGLFDAVSTVMLRYTLSRTVRLEAQSSTRANSIDMIWQREFR